MKDLENILGLDLELVVSDFLIVYVWFEYNIVSCGSVNCHNLVIIALFL